MDPRAAIPGIDRLLEKAGGAAWAGAYPAARLTAALRAAVEEVRAVVAGGDWAGDAGDPEVYLARARRRLEAEAVPSLRPVLNATGVVLHTNLGRAPLPLAARRALEEVTAGYANLEFDLEAGGRGSRYEHCAALVAELTGAEAGLVVNNCAGGLVLALNALARGRDVVVSRGEMVEIGGGFRIPEVLEQAGAGLRGVGATNRTRPDDYRAAMRAGGVAALLKVHRSNFRISGFTEEASLESLSELSREGGVPLIHDLGSGLLVPAEVLGLPSEPTPRWSLAAGADLVIFSGDKLLGGPQAGLIAGTNDLISCLRRSPLTRALRVDKGTLAALEATLRLYRDPDRALEAIPALRMLRRSAEGIRDRVLALREALENGRLPGGTTVSAVPGEGRVGGGTFPEHPLPSWTLRVHADDPDGTARRLRGGDPPVVARVEGGDVVLDLRTVEPDDDSILARRLLEALRRE